MKHEFIVAIDACAVSHVEEGIKLVSGSIENHDVYIAQREMLENNTAFRQVIPYTVLRNNGKIAVYRRTTTSGEDRLHGNTSIGFGGHIDFADIMCSEESVVDLSKTIQVGSDREINEELSLDNGNTITAITPINDFIVDNGDDVGKVHIGVASIVDVETQDVSAKEPHIDFLGFYSPSDIAEMGNNEPWTQVLLSVL